MPFSIATKSSPLYPTIAIKCPVSSPLPSSVHLRRPIPGVLSSFSLSFTSVIFSTRIRSPYCFFSRSFFNALAVTGIPFVFNIFLVLDIFPFSASNNFRKSTAIYLVSPDIIYFLFTSLPIAFKNSLIDSTPHFERVLAVAGILKSLINSSRLSSGAPSFSVMRRSSSSATTFL